MNRAWLVTLLPITLHAATPQTDLTGIQKALGIPTTIATVSDGKFVTGKKWPEIILIQDIHRHAEVQGHIAALVLHGLHHWGVQDVYLEGAQAHIPVALPSASPARSLRQSLQEGRLSGAEAATTLDPQAAIRLHGLEDPSLYLDNVMAYEKVEELRASALRELDTSRLMRDSFDIEPGNEGSDRYTLLRQMLLLKLKPADVTAYANSHYIHRKGSTLSDALSAAEAFYRLADKRSHQFLKMLESEKAGGPQMVIVGGYHTAMMARELSRQGRSFVVLTPQVTVSGYDELYARGMQETISALKLRD